MLKKIALIMNPMSNTRLLYLSFYVQSGMTRSANHLKLRIREPAHRHGACQFREEGEEPADDD